MIFGRRWHLTRYFRRHRNFTWRDAWAKAGRFVKDDPS